MKEIRMKQRKSFALIVGVLALTLAPAWAAVTAMKELPGAAQFTVDGGTLRIQFWSPEIVRVTYAAAAELPALKSLSVVASPTTVRLKRQQDDRAFTLATPRLKVKIDKQSGAVSFLDPADRVLLKESAQGRVIAPATLAGDAVTSAAQSFETALDEGIYGLGQHQRGVWNYSAGSGGNVARLFSTHPPTEERVARLQALAVQRVQEQE